MPKLNRSWLRNMGRPWKGRTLVGSVVLLGALISCAGTQTPKDRITDPGELLFNGQTVSGIDCYSCHNGDGTGGKIDDQQSAAITTWLRVRFPAKP